MQDERGWQAHAGLWQDHRSPGELETQVQLG